MVHIYVNGELLPASKACVSVQDRGFRYGDGVFETLYVHAGVPYQFDWHMARLSAGLQAIRIDLNIALLKQQARQLLQKNNVKEDLLRIQITRGLGGRGYLPDSTASPTIILETAPLPTIPQEPGTLWLSELVKIPARALPVRYKLCQGLQSTLARMEAADHDCCDALMLNERGEICETAAGNIFWLSNDTLYTPALSCGLLEGSTRAAIMRLSPWPVKEIAVHIEALKQAEAAAITSSVWPILPIGRLVPREMRWNSVAMVNRLLTALRDDREHYATAHQSEWR